MYNGQEKRFGKYVNKNQAFFFANSFTHTHYKNPMVKFLFEWYIKKYTFLSFINFNMGNPKK